MRQGQYLLMFVFKVLLQFRSTNTSCLTVRDVFKILIDQLLALIGRTGGGGVQGNLWYSPPFKMASKVFIEETFKNFDFITKILFRFLRLGDSKVAIVIEN